MYFPIGQKLVSLGGGVTSCMGLLILILTIIIIFLLIFIKTALEGKDTYDFNTWKISTSINYAKICIICG